MAASVRERENGQVEPPGRWWRACGRFFARHRLPVRLRPLKKRTVAATPRRPGVEQEQMVGDARPDVDGEVVGGRIGWRRGGVGRAKRKMSEESATKALPPAPCCVPHSLKRPHHGHPLHGGRRQTGGPPGPDRRRGQGQAGQPGRGPAGDDGGWRGEGGGCACGHRLRVPVRGPARRGVECRAHQSARRGAGRWRPTPTRHAPGGLGPVGGARARRRQC